MRKILMLLLLFAGLAVAQSRGTMIKTPYEVRNISLDMGPKANNGSNGVTLVSVVALNLSTNVDASAAIISANPAPSIIAMTEKVFIQLRGGSVGERYAIRVRVSKNDTGELLEGNVVLQIVGGI
jgi:hypothetical protein